VLCNFIILLVFSQKRKSANVTQANTPRDGEGGTLLVALLLRNAFSRLKRPRFIAYDFTTQSPSTIALVESKRQNLATTLSSLWPRANWGENWGKLRQHGGHVSSASKTAWTAFCHPFPCHVSEARQKATFVLRHSIGPFFPPFHHV
jgi:hypothetical protein